ncbi:MULTISPECIES: site-specific integrase [Alistipes]|jgi:intN1|uniref:site-specific integrase n=2 Tax=Rikenellaceae TaxID=171550 RepID=UPI001DFEC5D1|nr:site-specific integrase [Alistipes sp.]MBS6100095.1 phage integrase SAM-like domain-containing protein [Alistipes sp.]HJI19300.1 site-specific integrase [Rikenellaceae bacterium]
MGKTYYNISSKKDAAGESEIYMRIYVSKENRIRIATGIWVDAKRWGKKNEINIPNIPGEEQKILLEKKDKLKVLTEYVEKAVQLTEDKSTIDKPYLEKLIRKFHKPSKAKREFEKSFFEVIDTYLAAHKLSENRLKNFRVLIRCLHRFDLYKKKSGGRGFTLSFANLTPELLRQIEDFLLDEKSVFLQYPEIYEQFPYSAKVAVKTPKRKRPPTLDEEGNEVPKGMPQPRGQNTVSDMLTRFRAFILWAIDNGYTANNPFKHFTIGEIVYGTPIYISNEERNQLLEADLSDDKELETQRDIFVFQCLVGCRVSDLYKMTYRSIINDAVEYIPRKTKEDRPITVRVPLNDTARRLIAKYQDYDSESLFPFNTEQHYNRKIKEAFRRAGLDRIVTVLDQQTRQEVQKPLYEVASSHMARRTFIGNIYKKVKDPNLVGALSGHKEGSKAFARYRTIDDDMKKELIGFLD